MLNFFEENNVCFDKEIKFRNDTNASVDLESR